MVSHHFLTINTSIDFRHRNKATTKKRGYHKSPSEYCMSTYFLNYVYLLPLANFIHLVRQFHVRRQIVQISLLVNLNNFVGDTFYCESQEKRKKNRTTSAKFNFAKWIYAYRILCVCIVLSEQRVIQIRNTLNKVRVLMNSFVRLINYLKSIPNGWWSCSQCRMNAELVPL